MSPCRAVDVCFFLDGNFGSLLRPKYPHKYKTTYLTEKMDENGNGFAGVSYNTCANFQGLTSKKRRGYLMLIIVVLLMIRSPRDKPV